MRHLWDRFWIIAGIVFHKVFERLGKVLVVSKKQKKAKTVSMNDSFLSQNVDRWCNLGQSNLNGGHTTKDKTTEAVAQRCSGKNVFLEISENSHENTCARVLFLIKLQSSGLQVFSCEFCKISKNAFSYRTLPMAASKTK